MAKSRRTRGSLKVELVFGRLWGEARDRGRRDDQPQRKTRRKRRKEAAAHSEKEVVRLDELCRIKGTDIKSVAVSVIIRSQINEAHQVGSDSLKSQLSYQ